MRLGTLAATASALMLMASPALAATNPAAKLSVASAKSVRAGTSLKKSSGVAPVVVVLAVVVAIAGLGLATGVIGDDDDADSN